MFSLILPLLTIYLTFNSLEKGCTTSKQMSCGMMMIVSTHQCYYKYPVCWKTLVWQPSSALQDEHRSRVVYATCVLRVVRVRRGVCGLASDTPLACDRCHSQAYNRHTPVCPQEGWPTGNSNSHNNCAASAITHVFIFIFLNSGLRTIFKHKQATPWWYLSTTVLQF